jgi:hypothetical protein
MKAGSPIRPSAQNVVIAVNNGESMWTADLGHADVAELLTSMEQAVAGP